MKDWGEMMSNRRLRASLDAMRSRQILLSSDWERVWGKTMKRQYSMR